jgi:hypothetical protein
VDQIVTATGGSIMLINRNFCGCAEHTPELKVTLRFLCPWLKIACCVMPDLNAATAKNEGTAGTNNPPGQWLEKAAVAFIVSRTGGTMGQGCRRWLEAVRVAERSSAASYGELLFLWKCELGGSSIRTEEGEESGGCEDF